MVLDLRSEAAVYARIQRPHIRQRIQTTELQIDRVIDVVARRNIISCPSISARGRRARTICLANNRFAFRQYLDL
jgi:hypothetical protein